MITLLDVLNLLEKHNITDGYIVGGIAEHGFTDNDVDIITDAELSAPFHVITDSATPQGPAIDISKLRQAKSYLSSLKFMKPKKTADVSHEYYNLQDFKDFKGDYYIEPKWDGIRAAAAKIGPAILIMTDGGNFIQDKLQNISEAIRRIPYDVVILDTELVVYIRGQRGNHTDVTSYLHSTSPSEDYHLKLKPFDVLYLDGKDTRNQPLTERKALLEKVSWSEFIHPVKFVMVDGSKIIKSINSMTTAEGAMIKGATSTYNTAGDGWYKFKWQQVVDAKVTAVEKVTGGYIYTCEAGGTEIGKTYATNVVAKVGDIIAVSVDHITKTGTGNFTWYAPKVMDIRKNKTEPDTAAVLERMSAERVASQSTHTNAAHSTGTASTTGAEPVLQGPFVMQEHWWGAKHHFDLRFEKTNAEGQKVMIGFTLFANSLDELKSRLAGGQKLLAKEKKYHAPEWLTFHGEIPPGQTGNPTKNFTAHMEIRDHGHYTFAKRQSDFVDMTLDGSILKGRFYVRKVALKNNASENPNSGPKPGQVQPKGQASTETASGGESWLFWKAKDNAKANSADQVMFADSMNLHIDSSKLVDTKDGLLIKDAIICRAMVLDYGGKKVLKSPEVLAASMPTMQRMMITNNHPSARVITDITEINGRVLPETIKLIKDAAIGDLLITDKALADEVRKGKRDLSPGYFANIIDQTGTFNDEPYSAVQEDVIYDHLAVVRLGRCSRPRCGILDSDDSTLQEGDLEMVNDLNDKEKQVQDAATLASHMASYKTMMASMEEMLKQAPAGTRGQMVTLMGKMKSLMGIMMTLGDADTAKGHQISYNPDKGRIASMLGLMAEMEHMMSQLPPDLKQKMTMMAENVKSIMKMMDSEGTDTEDATLVDATGGLLPAAKADMPAEAIKLYETTYAAAKEGVCKDKTGVEVSSCPIKTAWDAVKAQFVKGTDGKWAKKTTNSTSSTDSSSSIIGEIKVQETKETMAESIVVDGVGYTPEMVKKLVADSAALTEAQKTANETKKLLDAREVAFVDQGKALAASEARIATMQATIDAAEQEKRAPLIKQIMDATSTLKIEDFKSWDLKRLADTAASTLEAARLRAKTDGKGTKSVVDDAYAKIGAKGGK